MKTGLKKIILTVLLAVALVFAFGLIIMLQNHATLTRDNTGDETLKQEEVSRTLTEIRRNWNDMERRIQERYKVDATLSALALRNILEEKGDQGIARYSNGAVVKVENGKITAPEGIDEKLGLTEEQLAGREGLFASPKDPGTLVVYSLIDEPFYYVQWFEDTNPEREVEEAVDIPGILRKAETAYDVYALCAKEDSDEEGGVKILYSNEVFTDLEQIFEETEAPDVTVEETDTEGEYESGTLSLYNGTFRYTKAPLPEINGYLVLLAIQPNLYVKALEQSSYMLTAMILFFAGLLSAGFSLYYFVRKNVLTPALEQRYAPAAIRRFACLYGIVGTVLIFLSGLLIYALAGLYDDSAKGMERLRMLEESADMSNERVKQTFDRFIDVYVDYGMNIAEAMDNYPELRERQILETLADSISASSITLYDANGKETASSGDYIGLSLSKDPESTTYDFRRVLNGVPYVAHDKETDETTGLEEIRIALRIKDAEDPSRYGAMIVSVDPALFSLDLSEMIETALDDLSGENTVLSIVDAETGEILLSSEESKAGRDISALGLDENDLKGSLIKNTEMDNKSWFVTSRELEPYGAEGSPLGSRHLIAYYSSVKKSAAAGMLASAATGSVLFLLFYGILAWVVLKDYTEDFFEKNKKIGKVLDPALTGRSGIRKYFDSILPERVGLISMEVIIAVYLLQLVPLANFKTGVMRNSVYFYIVSGQWEKGLNLFAVSGILLLLGETVLTVILIRLVLGVLSSFMGSRGKTICRLIQSLVMYLALFLFIIYALTYIGVSMSVILGAIAALGIAVSLGAQHFIADIIAGLTMVFEGTVHVGDIVDLGIGMKQYHGEVREIGMRFIRIQTRNGDIVTLSNRDITMATNMTQMNSRCVCTFEIFSDYPIEDIEELLRRELPEIGEKDRRILAGPVYDGVTAFGSGTMTISVTTECNERDVDAVQNIVNKSLLQLFRQNGYPI